VNGSGIYAAIAVESAAERERFCAVAGPEELSIDAFSRSGADESWTLAEGDHMVARCSLWWMSAPAYQEHRVGLIGHYAAHDKAAGAQLLALACARLVAQGCTLAIGPMDGSTHWRYRLVTEHGTMPPFLLEPTNPDDWPEHFTVAGFGTLARYCSALQAELEPPGPRLVALEQRLAERGVRIRPLDLARFDDEVRRIHAVVTAGFGQSFLYTPIAAEDMIEQYRPLQPYVVPDLVLLAEQGSEPVGFLFVIPDWLQARRGECVDTLILKTVAVRPEWAGRGLAGALIGRGLATAHALGYRRVIHALMHERNRSLAVSGRFAGQIMRRYTLYARPLEQASRRMGKRSAVVGSAP
jgi:GNAT superfamily N-acetyltransferase